MRKLSALKRPVPQRPAEELGGARGRSAGGAALVVSMERAGSAGGIEGGGSLGSSRKWMDPGEGDVPLSAAPVDAVGSGMAAVRSRVHSAEVYGSGSGSAAGNGGGGATGGRPGRPGHAREGPRRNSDEVPHATGATANAPGEAQSPGKDSAGGGGAAAADATQLSGDSRRLLAPLKRPGSGQGAFGGQPTEPSSPIRVGSRPGSGRSPAVAVAGPLGDGSINAEKYIAFAVKNPEVAMAAAQAALNANGGRARARWNLPPPEQAAPLPPQAQPVLLGAAAAAPPWSQQQHLQLMQQQGAAQLSQPQQHPLAAAMVAIPQAQQQQRPSVALMDGAHEIRRANSEGPRGPFGRPPPMLDMPPQPGIQPPPQLGAGPVPPMWGGPPVLPPPPQPGVPPAPGLFGDVPGGGWPPDGLHDGSGRLMGYGPGGPYPGLQPGRPHVPPGADGWGGGMGHGPQHMHPPPPPHMQQPGPPLPHWNGYGYPPNRGPSPNHGPGAGPAYGDPYGPVPDAHRQPPHRRLSGGLQAQLPDGGPGGPGFGPGGPGPDLPDYMRVSMSRMVAGWSAPNARHGALSGFNDVWSHRNNSGHNRPPQGYAGGPGGGGGPAAGPGQGSGLPPAPGAQPYGGATERMVFGDDPPHNLHPDGGGGGGARGTGFEGLSLAEVLASKPKKEPPNFKKGSGSGMKQE
ncbi:hypothetical protein GPECTOR_94g643 [Gonium pectorale]|uniref:Uncharacterized protein n=1 Tax=Gonium pectorale TaxID=33097 RepID=A0A150G0H2_GONPE|nr:hypothetical protein GPECTOR_94g643 [Gonium pectorale]|eukprot:KXZ43321.1 hypothetical protein GPECTOR_94g643 [Gonium pectorale]